MVCAGSIREARADLQSRGAVLEFGVLDDPAVALAIAGSDPSGGAGLQADLKTFHQFGVYGTAVPTLLTVQNSRAVERVVSIPADFVLQQLLHLHEDMPPSAAKVGAMGDAETVTVIARWASEAGVRLIVDPVIRSTSGMRLLSEDAIDRVRSELLPVSFLVTPNLMEAALLAAMVVHNVESMVEAAARISETGVENVLVKGGHLGGEPVDVLWSGGEQHLFAAERIPRSGVHGTGCAYSAAITALVSRGLTLEAAVRTAKCFLTEAIRTAPKIGHGHPPLNLHAPTGVEGH